MTIYFIRHGLSEGNVAGVFSGFYDHPLTDEGHEQAKRAGKKVAKENMKFDAIYASPLQRAHNTAKHVASAIDHDLDGIILRDDIKERNFGSLEGVTGINKPNFPLTLEEYLNDPFAIDHFDGVETITDLHYRAQKFLEFLESEPHETVLVVSHGAFGRAFERAIKNMPMTELATNFGNAEMHRLK